ncbi:MAG: hypothetical protein WDN04_11535 [Rhodospirillales bacterium]
MSTYRVIQVESGHWALEWWVDGVRQGLVWGWFDDEGDALLARCDLVAMEFREASGRMSHPG